MLSVTEKAKIGSLTKDQVSEWLSTNGIRIYDVDFEALELDGSALLGLIDLWNSNKIQFLEYARESLGIAAPGLALRFASLIDGVQLKDVTILN